MIKNIIFDFDGVILDSMPIRTEGFKKIFENYDNKKVEELISFHLINGGLSRFVKIKYFFEELLETSISEEEINFFADKYSKIMKENLINEKYLIRETVDFIKNNNNIKMFIASGSEEKELRLINESLQLSKYFLGIFGSPKNKIDIVKSIIQDNKLNKNETILIGDSINDYDAAIKNDIRFFGYNNIKLKNISDKYINTFTEGILWKEQ